MTGQRNAAVLEARAKDLRAANVKELTDNRAVVQRKIADALQERAAAKAKAETAEAIVTINDQSVAEERAEIARLRAEAEALDKQGLADQANEIRERIVPVEVSLGNLEASAAGLKAQAAEARAAEAAADALVDDLGKQVDGDVELYNRAEAEIDKLETQAEYLREAEGHDANVARLEQEIADLRAAGKDEEADRKTADLVDERVAADAKRETADAIEVDEAAVERLGVPPAADTPGQDASGQAMLDDEATFLEGTGTANRAAQATSDGEADAGGADEFDPTGIRAVEAEVEGATSGADGTADLDAGSAPLHQGSTDATEGAGLPPEDFEATPAPATVADPFDATDSSGAAPYEEESTSDFDGADEDLGGGSPADDEAGLPAE